MIGQPKILSSFFWLLIEDGGIAQLGAIIKTTSKCCFYLKRRSFLNDFVKRERAKKFRKRVTEATYREQEAPA